MQIIRNQLVRNLGFRIICLILILTISSCGWNVTPPSSNAIANSYQPIADSIVLSVNDGSVLWGNGELGELVKEELIKKGIFKMVYYPIAPRNPPNITLKIDARGSID
ncbi:MAG: hypothetical protein RIR39_2410, partial [Pseudomonadota bacterium]